MRAVSPEPSLFAHIKNSRRRIWPKIRRVAPLDGCACAFEDLMSRLISGYRQWYGAVVWVWEPMFKHNAPFQGQISKHCVAIIPVLAWLYRRTPWHCGYGCSSLALYKARHPTTVGSNLIRVTCETRQALLAGGQEVFSRGSFVFAYSHNLMICSAQN